MAERVGAALGLPLAGDRLASGAAAAARAMEGIRGADRDRATVYLETLFTLAGVPAERLGEVRSCLAGLHQERHLWCATADGTRATLERLRAAGLRLGVVSNSDGRVDAALAAAGLRACFEVVLDSALFGAEKPDPAIFRAALEALGVAPDEALYVGDLYEVDVVGARAAGIEAILLLPESATVPPGVRRVASLAALADQLLPGGKASP
jgi:HAD superfamily hydrolase (TIGR01509 family)